MNNKKDHHLLAQDPQEFVTFSYSTGHSRLCCILLQSNQVKHTPQEYINEFIIQKLNPLLVVDFRLISAFLHV